MANPLKGNSILADADGDPMLADSQANVADAAVTLATITASNATAPTWTYSANDPGTTPDGAVTFADGTALVAATVYEAFDEIEGTLGDLVTLTTELRADHATTITDLTTLTTKVNAIFDILEAHGLMKDA